MSTKETSSLKRDRDIALGQTLNDVIGDPESTLPLSDFMVNDSNRVFYGHVLIQTRLSPKEFGKYNRLLRATIRAGIDTVGALRIKTIEELAQIEGIGRESAYILEEAFKHPSST